MGKRLLVGPIVAGCVLATIVFGFEAFEGAPGERPFQYLLGHRPERVVAALGALVSVAAGTAAHLAAVARSQANELARLNADPQETQLHIRKLEGILPTCAWCGLVRTDDDSEWVELAEYLQGGDSISFSHGLCPTCERRADLQV